MAASQRQGPDVTSFQRTTGRPQTGFPRAAQAFCSIQAARPGMALAPGRNCRGQHSQALETVHLLVTAGRSRQVLPTQLRSHWDLNGRCI